MNIDAEKVIEQLMQKIATLTYENTVLNVALSAYKEEKDDSDDS